MKLAVRLRQIFLLIASIGIIGVSTAATIKGTVINSVTQAPLNGATIKLKNTSYSAIANSNGEFTIENVKKGTYLLQVSYLNCTQVEKEVIIATKEDIVVVDFALHEITKEISEVSVTGTRKKDKESDLDARKDEKNADNIVNITSAQTIQTLPDITAANVAQRTSGVSLERSAQGDGRYAIIRGMDARYNNTLINGVKIPSPNAKDRFVPLDVVPAELLQRMEISKTLRPDMEGDAIGGTINLVMKDAPDTTYVKSNLSSGYNQLFIDNKFNQYSKSSIGKDPYQQNGPNYQAQPGDFSRSIFDYKKINPAPNILGGATVGERFFNKKLGVLASVSYQNVYRGSTSSFDYTGINVVNQPMKLENLTRFYSTHQIRTGYNLKLDYRFNEKHSIKLYNVLLTMVDYEQRHTLDTITELTGTASSNYIDDRSKTQKQSIYNSTLQGVHQLYRNIGADWSLVYSRATGANPDWTENQLDYSNTTTNPIVYYDNSYHIWQKNTDQDYSFYGNLTYTPKIFNKEIEFKAGGLYRYKNRNNYFNEYYLRQGVVNGLVPPFQSVDTELYYVYNPSGTAQYGSNNYTANEQILAYYGQFKVQFGRLNVLAGMRVESTNQQFTTQSPAPPAPHTNAVNIAYVDPLGSVNLKYALTQKSNLRASFFQSISRPNFYELVPYATTTNVFTEVGNPYLKHTTSNNYDLKYEIYPNRKDFFSIGAFYKQINNPIELFTNVFGTAINGKSPQDFVNLKAVPYASYEIIPFNFGKCTNYGLEVAATKFFGPIGISGNYTYTSSNMQSVKIENDSALKETVSKLQNRPLQGQSKHIANASLLYKGKRNRINLQLAWNFTGKRIVQVSSYYGLDYYQQNYSLFDFSGEKGIGRHFVIFCKLNNLLNAPYRVALGNGLQVQKDYYSRNFQLGVRFTL
ncbi:MAG TPA: TonB-dependent receptor [Cytophagaceae bacterium]|jgi:outer membrane receptor protein involved in Fe transport|nr:TonB-dependent receptor [Cytophagaceae bacterium]